MDKRNLGQFPRRSFAIADLGAPLVMLLSIAMLHPYGFGGIGVRFLPSESANSKAASSTDPFRHAVNQAMRAAVLTQSAKTVDHWRSVEQHWQAAISFMKAVSSSSDKHAIAKQKAAEYQRNLAYASQKKNSLLRSKLTSSPSSQAAIAAQPPPPTIRSATVTPEAAPTIGQKADPVLTSQSALPSRSWLKVATGVGNQNFYIDTESISRNLPYVEFWQRVHNIEDGETVDLQDQRLLANCRTDRFQMKERVTYQAGKPNVSQPKTLVKAEADSAQARVIASACAGQ
jgi:hypothetical protein